MQVEGQSVMLSLRQDPHSLRALMVKKEVLVAVKSSALLETQN